MFDSGSHTRLLLIVLIHFKINVMLCYVSTICWGWVGSSNRAATLLPTKI